MNLSSVDVFTDFFIKMKNVEKNKLYYLILEATLSTHMRSLYSYTNEIRKSLNVRVNLLNSFTMRLYRSVHLLLLLEIRLLQKFHYSCKRLIFIKGMRVVNIEPYIAFSSPPKGSKMKKIRRVVYFDEVFFHSVN